MKFNDILHKVAFTDILQTSSSIRFVVVNLRVFVPSRTRIQLVHSVIVNEDSVTAFSYGKYATVIQGFLLPYGATLFRRETGYILAKLPEDFGSFLVNPHHMFVIT